MSEMRDFLSLQQILLNNPLMMGRLGNLVEPFVANNCVDIIQTIGRAMRGGMPCRVFFVDAAWAPRSASGTKDNESSSMPIFALVEAPWWFKSDDGKPQKDYPLNVDTLTRLINTSAAVGFSVFKNKRTGLLR